MLSEEERYAAEMREKKWHAALSSHLEKIQGVSKKRYFSDFCLVSVLEDGFYFFTCDLESES